MPEFKYVAMDNNGKHYRGVMNARDENTLVNIFKNEGKVIVSVSALEIRQAQKKLKLLVLADFCRELSVLLNAGVTLVRALAIIIEDDNVKKADKAVFLNVLNSIKKGEALSVAMQEQGKAFPPLMISMFRSAENSGNMDTTALKMANHFEKEHKLNSKINSAMVYPIILLVMMLAIIVFVCAYILPQFSSLFATMGQLPLVTQFIMAVSNLLVNYWYIIIFVVLAISLLLKIALDIEAVRLFTEKTILKLPFIGRLLRTIYTARFARTLNSLYSSGVAILTALPVAVNTVGNKYIESQFPQAVVLLQQGEPLAKALSVIDGFESKLVSSIKVGEEAGNLDTMLEATADAYDFSAEQSINKLVTLVEPIMLIIIGILVCVVMLGVLLPIFESYNAIDQNMYS